MTALARMHPRHLRPLLLAGVSLGSALALLAPSAGACISEDLDASGAVDGADLGRLLAEWGPSGGLGPADLDGSGEVDAADLGLLLAAWGDVPSSACLALTGVSPASGSLGTEVTLAGTFPDPNFLNYSLVALGSWGVVVPFEVTAVSSSSLTARVGPFPAGTTSGTFAVTLGLGSQIPADQLPTGFDYAGPAWVWNATGDSVLSTVEFHFDAPASPIDGTYFGSVSETGLVVTVTGDCAANTEFGMWIDARQDGADAHNTVDTSFAAVALRLPPATLQQSQDTLSCAQALCDLINAIYLAQSPNPIQGDCTIQLPAEGFTLGSYVDSVDATSGAFVIRGTPG